MSNAPGTERLKRLLFLVPYVARHPGLSVDEVAKAAGMTREDLLGELEMLTLVGRPPFQPDDYIDIYVEDDRVYVDLDQRLSAPPRLTASEGVALAAAAELLRPAAGDALTAALKKLETALPATARERFREMARKLDLALDAPEGLAALSQAIVEHREVELDYFSAGTGSTERRTVQPHELFSHRGQWYLEGYCLSRVDQRLFRLDRIASLQLTSRTFAAPAEGRKRSMPVPTRDGASAEARVTVRFDKAVAPYVAERFGDDAVWVNEGALEVTVPGDSERWLTQWVLSFGGDAVVLSPEWARKAVARAAAASLDS